MAKIVQIHRFDTAVEADAYTGPAGELTPQMTDLELRLHDGVTAGGKKFLNETQIAALYQPLDADLTAFAALDATAGLLVKTGANAYTRRTLTGTANEVTVANGNGVSGNPTISLPSALTFTGKTVTGGTFSGVTLSGTTTLASGHLFSGYGKIVALSGEGEPASASEILRLVRNSAPAATAAMSIIGGSAGVSGLYFGDKDNSISGRIDYDHSTDTLRLAAGGSAGQVYLSSTGNVGIGTSSPQGVLDLGLGSAGRSIVWGGATGANHYASIGTAYSNYSLILASGLKLDTTADALQYSYTGTNAGVAIRLNTKTGTMQFYTEAASAHTAGNAFSNSPTMTLDASGNLSIGTTSASGKLTVYSNAGASSDVLYLRNSDGATTQRALIVTIDNTNGRIKYNATGAAAAAHDWQVAGSTKMLLDTNGNVGIGTSTPIAGVSNSGSLTISGTAAANLFFEDTGYEATGDGVGYFTFNDGALSWATASRSSGATTGSITRFTVDASGNLLVGVTSGSYHVLAKEASASVAAAIRNTSATNPSGQIIALTAASPDNNTSYFLQCIDSTTTRLYIYSDGDVVNHDNSYGAISDLKLKQDITLAGSQWDDVKALGKIVSKYRLKTDVEADPNAPSMLGFVAQDVQAISPGLVEASPDFEEVQVQKLDGDGNPIEGEFETVRQPTGTETLSVKYSIAYMKAFKALAEALEEIDSLKARLAAAGL